MNFSLNTLVAALMALGLCAGSALAAEPTYKIVKTVKGFKSGTGTPGNGTGPGTGTPLPGGDGEPNTKPGTLALSDTALIFGDVAVGASSTMVLDLTNTGDGPVTGLSISSTGAGFLTQSTCGTSLGAHATCRVSSTFTPAGPQTSNGALTVASSNSSTRVPLSGTGLQALVSVDQSVVDLGSVNLGATSAVKQVTLRNQGNVNAVLSGISIATGADEFGQDNKCSTISPAGSCLVSLQYTPLHAGSATGALAVVAPNGLISVVLKGAGVGADVAAPASTDFGIVETGAESTKTLSFTNNGNVASSNFYVTVGTANYLSTLSSDCGTSAAPISLAVGASCSLVLKYAPMGKGQLATSLTSTWAGGSKSQTLTATATQPDLEVSHTSVDFGAIDVGSSTTQTVSIRNKGPGTAYNVYSTVTNTTDVTLENNTCGTAATKVNLAQGATCTVDLKYHPSQAGVLNSLNNKNWNILSYAYNSNINVPLSGTANGSIATLQSGDLTFGAVTQNVIPVPSRTLVFKNTGQKPMSITGLSGLPSFATSSGTCNGVTTGNTCSLTVSLNVSSVVASTTATVTTVGADTPVSIPFSGQVTGPATSCAAIKSGNASAASGLYTIDPDGSATGYAPQQVYCDMTTDGGGWTLVIRVAEANRAHVNTAAVGTLTSPSQSTTAKLSDAYLKAIPQTAMRFAFDANGGALYMFSTYTWNSTGSAYGAGNRRVSSTYTGSTTTISSSGPDAAYLGFGCYNGGWLYTASTCFNYAHTSASGSEVAGFGWNQKISVWVR